jgi:predicted O-methyltransferase YrrM
MSDRSDDPSFAAEDREVMSFPEKLRPLDPQRAARHTSASSVLEIGSGIGTYSLRIIAIQGSSITCVEVDPRLVEAGRATLSVVPSIKHLEHVADHLAALCRRTGMTRRCWSTSSSISPTIAPL